MIPNLGKLQELSNVIAEIDVLSSFAYIAKSMIMFDLNYDMVRMRLIKIEKEDTYC